MSYCDDPRKTFTVGATALDPFRLCKLVSNLLVVNTATATDQPIGVTENLASASGPGAVKLLTSPGTVQIEAAGATTAGADVYAAADGKIQALPVAAGTYRKIGIGLQAASGAGAVIEVLPVNFNSTTTVSS